MEENNKEAGSFRDIVEHWNQGQLLTTLIRNKIYLQLFKPLLVAAKHIPNSYNRQANVCYFQKKNLKMQIWIWKGLRSYMKVQVYLLSAGIISIHFVNSNPFMLSRC